MLGNTRPYARLEQPVTDEVAAAARTTWALGDYAQLAKLFAPAATDVAATAGPGHGSRALDVAAGTGSLAQALAPAGWRTTATDVTPRLIDEGRRSASEAGLDIDWHEASLDSQPFDDGSFDLVGSSFGLIFATDPVRMLSELRRVVRESGLLAYSAWTPTSYPAEMTAVMAAYLPGDGTGNPFRWGDPSQTGPWLEAAGFSTKRTTNHALPWRFESADSATNFMFTNSPGHVAAMSQVDETVAERMRGAVRDHLTAVTGPDGSVDIAAEYVVTLARPAA